MKNVKIGCLFAVIAFSVIMQSCGPGQLFGPTITPVPTFTPTPSTGTIKGKVINTKLTDLMITICTVIKTDTKAIVFGDNDHAISPDSSGNFLISNVDSGSWYLCAGHKSEIINRKYYPIVDTKNKLVQVTVNAGETIDIGEIKIVIAGS
jgi:hypothetical protein